MAEFLYTNCFYGIYLAALKEHVLIGWCPPRDPLPLAAGTDLMLTNAELYIIILAGPGRWQYRTGLYIIEKYIWPTTGEFV